MADNQDLVNLETAALTLLCPLYVVMAIHDDLEFCFATADRDPPEYRRIICFRWSPRDGGLNPKMPILFELVGQIAISNCYLTKSGSIPLTDDDEDGEATSVSSAETETEEAIATCWIEPRPDIVSSIYWRSVYPTVKAIMASVPLDVQTRKVLWEPSVEGEMAKVQVFWQPPLDETIESSLPMYDEDGNRIVPASISDVPFGRPVRVLFTLEYYYTHRRPGSGIALAPLAYLALL